MDIRRPLAACLALIVAAVSFGLQSRAQTQPGVAPSTQPTSQPATRPNPNARTGFFSPGHNPALPTVFLIGDSTVKNGRGIGSDGLWGWGAPLAAYFDATKVNIENQALGGTSSNSYQSNNWPGVLALVKPGDFVIMQFGHNDNGGVSLRGNGDETGPARGGRGGETHTFGWYIRKYVTDTRAKGATPIVCSLIPRNIWANGKISRSETHAMWAKQAAEQEKALFLDLNKLIADRYDTMGQEAVKPFFPKDGLHTGWRGSVLNAECVVEGIRALPEGPLTKYLVAEPKPVKPRTDPTDGMP